MQKSDPEHEHLYWRTRRRLPVGAEVFAEGVHFRLWAPRCRNISLLLEDGAGAGEEIDLYPEAPGYFARLVPSAAAGSRYRFRPDGLGEAFPDPASRFQPQGPFGPSQVIDSQTFVWSDQHWPGVEPRGQVIYELHIGTFTAEGTWRAACQHLPELASLGVTVLEILPVGDFPGRFGWGYDSVNLFAPTRLYGPPDEMRRFVDQAHALGLGVILDIVINHFGAVGNFIGNFAPDFFIERHRTQWGDSINFEGENSGPVREFFQANVACWIEEYHLDGLRIDATQDVHDQTPEHILAALVRTARQSAGERKTFVIGENEPQQVQLLRPAEAGGFGFDGLWNDDFHHSARVALTGRTEAYYTDYRGTAQEFVSLAKWGYLYQGQRYRWQRKRRGTPTFGLPGEVFVNYLQNHDQVANSAGGRRLHLLTSPARLRAMTALLLLGPWTPLLFQGQEFAASTPFCYFADIDGELAESIARGRAQFLAQFPSLALPEMQQRLPDPTDHHVFASCRLDHGEREGSGHGEILALHRDLLRLRRDDAVLAERRAGGVDGAVLGQRSFCLRFFGDAGDDRLLLINLDGDRHLDPAPEPLLAPPYLAEWRLLWSSEDPCYGGSGSCPPETEENWRLPAESALLLTPHPLLEKSL
jgi:maltooligosyltrehalose trehalohydrolase